MVVGACDDGPDVTRVTLHEFAGPIPLHCGSRFGWSPAFLNAVGYVFTTVVVAETRNGRPFAFLLHAPRPYSDPANDVRAAARVDGRGPGRLFWEDRALPLLMPTLWIAATSKP